MNRTRFTLALVAPLLSSFVLTACIEDIKNEYFSTAPDEPRTFHLVNGFVSACAIDDKFLLLCRSESNVGYGYAFLWLSTQGDSVGFQMHIDSSGNRNPSTMAKLRSERIVVAGGLYFGESPEDNFLACHDMNGTKLWELNLGEGSGVEKIRECENGDILVIGTTVFPNDNFVHAQLRRVSPEGNLLWSYSRPDRSWAMDAVDLESSEIILAGWYYWNSGYVRLSQEGEQIGSTIFMPVSEDGGFDGICGDTSGNVFTTGWYRESSSSQNNVIFVAEIVLNNDSLGWVQTYADSGYNQATEITINESIGLTTAGNLNTGGYGSWDFLAARTSRSGSTAWVSSWGTEEQDVTTSMAVDESGNVLVAGYSYKDSGYGSIACMFDNSGQFVWGKDFNYTETEDNR